MEGECRATLFKAFGLCGQVSAITSRRVKYKKPAGRAEIMNQNRVNNIFIAFPLACGAAISIPFLFHRFPVLNHPGLFLDLWLSLAVFFLVATTCLKFISLKSRTAYYLSILFFLGISALLIMQMSSNNAFELYYADFANSGPIKRNIYSSPITIGIAIFWAIALLISSSNRTVAEKIINEPYAYIFNGIAVFLAISGGYFFLLTDISPYNQNALNFGVVVMPIVNAFFGALPPLDSQSQYGLYPLFFVPILKVLGISITTISLIFALIFSACLYSLYAFTLKGTSNPLIAISTLVACFYLNTSFGNIFPGELYIQYRPIRMAAPCIALFLVARGWGQGDQPVAKRLMTTGLLSTLVLWNVDSGIVTLGAFLCASALDAIFRSNEDVRSKLVLVIRILIEGIFGLLLAFGALELLMLNSGGLVTFNMILEPQLAFTGGNKQFFLGLFQALMLPMYIYAFGLTWSIYRGLQGKWGSIETMCVFVSLLGVGLATYSAGSHPSGSAQTAAIASYPMVLLVALLAGALVRLDVEQLNHKEQFQTYGNGLREAGSAVLLFVICYLATSFIFHARINPGYSTVPTILELIFPDSISAKGIWEVPGKIPNTSDYVKVGDLTAAERPQPSWAQKAQWLKSLDFINPPVKNRSILIASTHDYYLYMALGCAAPFRYENFLHIPIYKNWPQLFALVSSQQFEYIVIDETHYIRYITGMANFDHFMNLTANSYEKIIEKEIGSDWNGAAWNPTVVSVWRRRTR